MEQEQEWLVGRNSLAEALKTERPINKILVAKGPRQGSLKALLGQAKEKGILIQEVDLVRLDKIAGDVKHQGVAFSQAPIDYWELDELLQSIKTKDEPPFLVLLDELEDPHNVGAILRTADAAGVHGILMPRRRSCPLNATVAKASAGAVHHVPVARIGNVAQTLAELKEQGFWVFGAHMEGQQQYYEADWTGPVVLVIGSEGKGISRLVKEACDVLVQIPMKGKIQSLNASVACSLLMYEALRQRQAGNK